MAIDMLIRKKWDKFSLDINFKNPVKTNRYFGGINFAVKV